MIKDISPLQHLYEFGGARLRLRFDLASFLLLEDMGLNYNEIFSEKITGLTLLRFFEVGLAEKIDKNRLIAIINADTQGVINAIRSAVILALPKPDPMLVPQPRKSEKNEIDWVRLYSIFVDVMHRTDEEFWSCTLREVLQRWTSYAVVKGLMKEPEHFKLYDDDSEE